MKTVLTLILTAIYLTVTAQDSSLCRTKGHVIGTKEKEYAGTPKSPYVLDKGDTTFVVTPGKLKYNYWCLRCKRKFEKRAKDKIRIYSIKRN